MSSLHLILPRTAASPAQARQEASRFVADRDGASRAEVALLVLSELVTNAVLHGADPIQVLVSWDDDALLIEVSDGDPDTTKVVPTDPRAGPDPGGRGLRIVSTLARSWGTTKRDDGKSVWAEVVLGEPHEGD